MSSWPINPRLLQWLYLWPTSTVIKKILLTYFRNIYMWDIFLEQYSTAENSPFRIQYGYLSVFWAILQICWKFTSHADKMQHPWTVHIIKFIFQETRIAPIELFWITKILYLLAIFIDLCIPITFCFNPCRMNFLINY